MTEVLDLVERGLTPAEAVDYHAVVEEGLSQTEWGQRRGIAQSSVSENVSKARRKLTAE